MAGKAAGSPAYWRDAGDRERSQAGGTGPTQRDFGHAALKNPSVTADDRQAAVLAAAAMVAEPITRVRSYSTIACPGATPRAGRCRRTRSSLPIRLARAGTGAPWARTWAEHATSPSGAGPHHRGLRPTTSSTSSISAGPTVTVRRAGEMSKT